MVKNFGLLVGTPVSGKLPDHSDSTPHFTITVSTSSGATVQVVVNVRSRVAPKDLYTYYNADSGAWPLEWCPPAAVAQALEPLGDGWHAAPPVAADYVQTFRADLRRFRAVQCWGPGTSDFEELLPELMSRATAASGDPQARRSRIYAFGQRYGSGPGGLPAGVHDIHMNQGNRGRFAKDNGRGTDGLLLVRLGDGSWAALLAAFQAQWLENDDRGMATQASMPVPRYVEAAGAGGALRLASPHEHCEARAVLTRAMAGMHGAPDWVEVENLGEGDLPLSGLVVATAGGEHAVEGDSRVLHQFYRAIIELSSPLLQRGWVGAGTSGTVRLAIGETILDYAEFCYSGNAPWVFNRPYAE
eukprot:m51a1_g536 hypothetical protein (358) ;mRNA; f:391012-392344